MVGYIKHKIYIPEEDVDMNAIEKAYQFDNFEDTACDRCPYKKDRPNEYCQTCQAYLGLIRMWSRKVINGKSYILIPSGNMKRASEITGIDFSNYKDLRCCAPFESGLKWTGQLRHGEMVNGVPSANQEELVEKWLQPHKRYGFIQAPPRTGKSVCGVYLSCAIGYKTLFVAHQTELLENFYKSFVRDTNLLELREETGKEIVSIINSPKDYEKMKDLDVALVTYQKFIREDTRDKLIKEYIKGRFGFVITDEAHQAGAASYARFLSQLDCRYKLGMSATPLRKDALNRVLFNCIGPVTVKSESTGLIPRIEIFETGIKEKSSYCWAKTMQKLQKNEKRNKLILKEVVKDLKEHKVILIPVDTKEHMELLVNSINNQYGDEIAFGYHSGCKNRKNILKDIDEGKYRVVVAIKSMIKQGIDLKLPTMIYVQVLMSAAPQPKGSPMFFQMGNRVCTPYLGKREPIVKIFVDNLPESYGCFMSLMTKEIGPGLKAPEGGRPKYKMSAACNKYAWEMVKQIGKRCYSQSATYNPDYMDKRPYVEDSGVSSNLLKGSWL